MQKGVIPLAMVLFAGMILVLGISIFVFIAKPEQKNAEPETEQTVCTAEAMQCPDGSYVTRSRPSCEFDPCPRVFPTATAASSATPTASGSAKPAPSLKACTMDAKICPDGTSVGRTGPNCEFAPCTGVAKEYCHGDLTGETHCHPASFQQHIH